MDAQKKEKVLAVQRSIAAGMTVPEACKANDVNFSTYYEWRKKFGLTGGKKTIKAKVKTPAKPQFLELPLVPRPSGQLALIIGSPEQIMQIAKGLN